MKVAQLGMKEGDLRREMEEGVRECMGDKFEINLQRDGKVDYTFCSYDKGVTSDRAGDIERLRNKWRSSFSVCRCVGV